MKKLIELNILNGFRYYLFFNFFLYLTVANAVIAAEVVDRIVAIVNDDIITLSELEQAEAPYREKIKSMNYLSEKEHEMLFKLRQDIIKRMVDDKLTDQEVKRAKITVGANEVNAAIEKIKETNYLTEEKLREGLKAQGMTMLAYRQTIKEQILRRRLVNLEVRSKVIITDDDIRAYYEKHKGDLDDNRKYHLWNIIMSVPPLATEEQKQEIYRQMEDVRSKFLHGEAFNELLESYKPYRLVDGGDLGTFPYSTLAPKLQKAIEGLRAGDITQVINAETGFQLFYIKSIENLAEKTMADVSPEIEEKLYNEIVNRKFAAWLDELRSRSHIKIQQ
ncbi:SurA N-terminal domain-containing protein [Desulfococcaceae bacterium HSG7]|nr:SurA N-terminal domain-containing protein [Desulfococcaceae bacterium HSG7]